MHVDSWSSSIDFQLTKSKAFHWWWIKAILHAGSIWRVRHSLSILFEPHMGYRGYRGTWTALLIRRPLETGPGALPALHSLW